MEKKMLISFFSTIQKSRSFNIPAADNSRMDGSLFAVNKMPAKIVMGIKRRTSNADGRSVADIPACWQEFLSQNMASKITNRSKTPAMFAVYSEYDSDWTGEY